MLNYLNTQKTLDESPSKPHDVGVKFLLPSIASIALLTLTLTGCKPESIDPERLSFILDQNTKLKQSIQSMQYTIDQAGSIDPSLPERISALESEIKDAIIELNTLAEEENASQIRVLELESRLDAFSLAFEKMQSQMTTAAQH